MRIENCYLCSSKVYPGHGMMFVRNDCKQFRFCRSKCHNAFKRKKNPRRVRWTKTYRKTHAKELCADPAFEFQKRRNVPAKYNRELWKNTVDALQRITAIRQKRENRYVEHRLNADKYHALRRAKHMVDKHMHILRVPAADLPKKTKDTSSQNEVKFTEEDVAERIESKKKVADGKKKDKEVLLESFEDAEMLEEDSNDNSDDYESMESDDDSEDDSNDKRQKALAKEVDIKV